MIPLLLGAALLLSGPAACSGGSKCYTLEVTCPAIVQPIEATLRVKGRGRSGTVLALSGGGGTEPWDEFPTARQVLRDLQKDGYRTAVVTWADNVYSGSSIDEGPKVLACRSATAFQWVMDNLHDASQPICATGTSGGAAQIAYAMSHYAQVFDAAVLAGGPPMSRLDLGCELGSSSLNYSAVAKAFIDGSYGTASPCSRYDAEDALLLFEDSLNVGGEFALPPVSFVFGALDQSSAVAQGLLYADSLDANGTPVTVEYAADTGHVVQTTASGAALIFSRLAALCN